MNLTFSTNVSNLAVRPFVSLSEVYLKHAHIPF